MSASAIYTGTVAHRRLAVRANAFRYPVSYVYLDLDELPTLLGGRLLRRRPGPWRFHRSDYLGPTDLPLAVAVRDRVAALTDVRPEGPVRLLTQLRCFGVHFNPLNLYYCFTPDGSDLQAVLAEVTNTPWRERHTYALGPWEAAAGPVHATVVPKALHVSPFLPMDLTYDIRLTAPAETLSVHIGCERAGAVAFEATLGLTRSALSPAGLAGLIRRDPFGPLKTLRRIYRHGVALKVRGVPVHPHPSRGVA
ncbi:DUF1365 domain-containing protein [Conexibacter sp. DBS9H8]|uniref:DUF1365 domain-containing protein n=1 Tax=Conexibacter sp. DBS9H8 TaxID=2937801 RepID=UPI00200E510B|nr:DUF1365 domain-containing protein [Conexibacter sp. DBS9H8]